VKKCAERELFGTAPLDVYINSIRGFAMITCVAKPAKGNP